MKQLGLAIAAVFVLSLSVSARANDEDMAVIELHHRLAEEIAELVKPLLDPGEVIIPNRNNVIVKAKAAKLAEVNALIQELDRPRHRLLITLAQGSGLSREDLNLQASIEYSTGPAGQGRTPPVPYGHAYSTDTGGKGTQIQRVQTLDGQPADISFGSQIPVPSAGLLSPYPAPNAVIVNPGIAYRELSTGFSVTARLSGQEVFLDVLPWSEQMDRRGGGVIESQTAKTSVQARLGAWTEIAGETESVGSVENGPLSHHYETRSTTRKTFIKVDDLDAAGPTDGRNPPP